MGFRWTEQWKCGTTKFVKWNVIHIYNIQFPLLQLFQGLNNYRVLNKDTSDLWLLLEAEEDLIDDVCLPVDTKASGNSDPIDRTSKSRLDRSLSATGAAVQKVMAFAYDPEFTCTTKSQTVPLVEEISTDSGRPIISNCSFHSSANRSVVVIGYNLDGETQGFQVISVLIAIRVLNNKMTTVTH